MALTWKSVCGELLLGVNFSGFVLSEKAKISLPSAEKAQGADRKGKLIFVPLGFRS